MRISQRFHMKKSVSQGKWWIIMSFLLPSFIGFAVFIFLPMLTTLGMAFTNYSGGTKWKFIGLTNFRMAFFKSQFPSYLYLTFKFMFVTVFFQIVLGLGFALILAKPSKGCGFFRSAFYIPNILSSVAVGLAFNFIFEPSAGLMNQLLASVGLPTSKFLTSDKSALGVIMAVTIWQNFGYYMVLFIGGLQNINPSLYEASNMDGANKWQQFWSVTIPGLSPVLFFAITMAVIRGFQVFDFVYVMTGGQAGGGPGGSTTVLAFDIYRNAFQYYRMGYAASESLILMVIILAITAIQQIGQKKWVVYDAV